MQAGRGREGVGAGSKNHSRCLVKVNRREDFSIYFVIARGVREVWGSVGRRGVGAASRGRWQAGCAVVGAGGRAFSAPRICTVEAGCLARFISEPACAINLAPTSSPTTVVRLGAIAWRCTYGV